MSGEPLTLDCASVRCDDLRQLLVAETQFLVVDARPYSEYILSHVKGALSVRLSQLLLRRLSRGKLTLGEVVSDAAAWANKPADCLIVVYDDDASYPAPFAYDPKNPMHVILFSLQKEGRSFAYLHGGFTAFKAAAPEWCRESNSEAVEPSAPLAPLTMPPPALPLFPTQQQLQQQQQHPAGVFGSMVPMTPHLTLHTLPPSEVLPFLYIGSRNNAADEKVLEDLGIKFVLNVTTDCPHFHEHSLVYKRLSVRDTWNQNLQSYFSEAFEFIELARKSDCKILVHCVAGVSRSSAIVIAYIMRAFAMSLSDAYTFVKSKRPIISPNLDFMGELRDFEVRLRNAVLSGDEAGGLPPAMGIDAHALMADDPVDQQQQQQQQQQDVHSVPVHGLA